MIARLVGETVDIAGSVMVLDVHGVGYEVEVSSSVLEQQMGIGEVLTLHTHLVVREDAQLLFGFATVSERDLFRAFIKLNGVGPKMGLALISALPPASLLRVVQNNDVATLTKVPGVGKKTAERLMLELKNRIESLTESGVVAVPVVALNTEGVDMNGGSVGSNIKTDAKNEAEEALVALGYRPQDAQRAVAAVLDQYDLEVQGNLSTQDVIRQALRGFAQAVSNS